MHPLSCLIISNNWLWFNSLMLLVKINVFVTICHVDATHHTIHVMLLPHMSFLTCHVVAAYHVIHNTCCWGDTSSVICAMYVAGVTWHVTTLHVETPSCCSCHMSSWPLPPAAGRPRQWAVGRSRPLLLWRSLSQQQVCGDEDVRHHQVST